MPLFPVPNHRGSPHISRYLNFLLFSLFWISPATAEADRPLGALSLSERSLFLRNVFTGERHALEFNFTIEIENVPPLSESNCSRATVVKSGAQMITAFEYDDFVVERVILDGPLRGFSEVQLRVKNKSRKAFHVERVVCGEFRFREPFEQVIAHTDGSLLATPINLFLRTKRGGIILGLAYPYQEMIRSDDRRTMSLGYPVHADIAAGADFETETLFIGTYKNTGLGIYKPLRRVPYRFITPHPEERDLAEVRTMQEYVRTKTPYYPVPGRKQLFMFLNSWWAGKSLSELPEAMALMAQIGVPEVMTKETEYGMSSHIASCPELENLPLNYRFQMPEPARKLVDYGREIGVRLATFVNPPRAFRPEWELRDKYGKPVMYGQIPSVCFASREAADFSMRFWDQLLKAGGSTFLGFDGRILTAFNEVDASYFGKIGPILCHATNHGHRPGQNAYHDYKNSQWMLAELRRLNPQAFLEVYWGVKRGMPWSMASFSGCESWYESNGHQDDRMQAWYNQNYRFLPPYHNFAALKGSTESEFRKNLISCLGTSSHLQLGSAVKLMHLPANQEFFRKWTEWAHQNHQYLNVKFDMFGQPWAGALDGSARIVDGKGFLFLFNESAADQVARIPLSSAIGLARKSQYNIVQIYPDERRMYSFVKHGRTIQIPVPAGSASILRVEPSTVKSRVPDIAWHNLQADVRLDGSELLVEGLRGCRGQRREIVILLGNKRPSRLTINGTPVPFRLEGQAVIAGICFERPSVSRILAGHEIWEDAPEPASGPITVTPARPLRSNERLGDGVYELDVTCNFSRGGFFFRADESLSTGVMATALLSWFAGTNGNIAFWHANLASFPIHWTLGNQLEQGRNYRFRVESYGHRHSFSVMDLETGAIVAGPLSYVIDSVEQSGYFGVRVEKGEALVGRVAFTPAEITHSVAPDKLDFKAHIHDAFTPTSVTSRYGQMAPPGTHLPGIEMIDGDYAKEQEALWGGKRE